MEIATLLCVEDTTLVYLVSTLQKYQQIYLILLESYFPGLKKKKINKNNYYMQPAFEYSSGRHKYQNAEAYLEPCETPMIERFAKTVNKTATRSEAAIQRCSYEQVF